MPTYEYQCGTCGYRFDKFQSFSEDPLKECPQCGHMVKKLISRAGVIFKGSGWYINDSKATTPAAKPATTDSDSKSGDSTDSTKDSKPAEVAASTEPAKAAPAEPAPKKGKEEAA
jgi:putative FmdB family regulatory protein